MILFQFIAGPRSGQRLETPAPTVLSKILIGRSREAAIFIDSTDVSRRHAEIFLASDGFFYVHDLGSRNGTLVNGQYATLQAPLRLLPGNVITVGTSQFSFEGLFNPAPFIAGGNAQTVVQAGPNPSLLPPNVNSFAYLILRSNGQRFLLSEEQMIVGRAVTNPIVIDAKSISRHHARLQQTVAGYTVTDLGSTNKTFVNNQVVEGSVLLRSHDIVRFGEVETEFRLETERITQQFQFGTIIDESASTNPDSQALLDLATKLEVEEEEPAPREQPHRNLEHGETRLNMDVREVRGVNRNQVNPPIANPNTPFPNPVYPPLPEILYLEGVFKNEGSGKLPQPALRNVQLRLGQGELVALVGPSNNGLNLLLPILAALEVADQGLVRIFGRIMPTLENTGKKKLNLEDDKELVRWRNTNIGYLSLNPILNLRASVLDNIAVVLESRDPRERRDQAWEQLRTFGLTNSEFERLRPNDLSIAERQKLALVRALATNPPLLILGEPAANLTGYETAQLFDILKRLSQQQGKTILIASQNQFWQSVADRHYEMLNGVVSGG
jgi:putative ABC transport system ATP-binding protein